LGEGVGGRGQERSGLFHPASPNTILQIMIHQNDDQIKEEIRNKADIAAVIGRYVSLKGSGGALKGLCPFHKEKTPSFHVNANKGFFHCFGCGKGGDVFTFLQEIEGVQFYDALKMLAEETGVELGNAAAGQGDIHDSTGSLSKTRMLEINEIASKFYYAQIKNSPEAIEYFKSRGLKGETVRDFRLGYAPSQWGTFITYCQQFKITQDELIECGLAIAKDSGGAYDRFRNRVMFTLTDLSGKPIGFAGRGMDDTIQPKYLNSPETLLYKKKHFLYGLYKARQAIKEHKVLYIVEGYMDYLSLYQAGIQNVAATSGTAITPEHAHIIQRFSQNVVFVFDSDKAGQAAAVRGIFILAPLNFDISVLTVPDAKDPDEFIKKFGPEKFIEVAKKAQSWMHYSIKKAMEEHDPSTPRGKSAAVEYLRPLTDSIKDPIILANFKKEIAELLEIKEQLMYNGLHGRTTEKVETNESSINTAYLQTLEGSFLRILITSPELINEAKNYVSPETLTDHISSDIYSLIIETFREKGSLDGITDKVNEPVIRKTLTLLLVNPALMDHIHDELVQKIIHLRAKFLRASIRDIKLQMKNEPNHRTELLIKLKDFSTQLKDLDAKE
jgi:DNA primase